MKENFDYEKVKESMKKIENLYNSFSQNVASINHLIEDKINKPNGAVYGEVGMKLKKLWMENCSNYDEFYKVFDSWSNAVVQMGMNNIKLEEFAASIKK